jgi:hypothetical protein
VDADNSIGYYNGETASDDPRLHTLIAQVAPVEVRPHSPSPAPPSPSTRSHAIVRSAGSFCPRRRSPPPWPPRCTPTPPRPPHAVADGRATQPNNSHNAKYDNAVTCSRTEST